MNSLRYLPQPQQSLGCLMTGAFSSYFHAIRIAYRFQFPNSVQENLHLTLAVLIYSAGGFVTAGWVLQIGEAIQGQRLWIRQACMSRVFTESNLKLSWQISWRRTATRILLALPGEHVGISGSERAVPSLLCTRGRNGDTGLAFCRLCLPSPPTDENVSETWRLFLPLS